MEIIHANQLLADDGWHFDQQIIIDDDGIITGIGAQDRPADTQVGVLLPAPTNLHSHAFQRAMAGLTEARGPDPRDSFWTWRQLMYRYLDRLNPDDIEAIAEMVFLEMLEAGFASVAEFHYLHHDVGGTPYAQIAELSERIVAAAQNTGIGLTLLPVFYQYGGCDKRALNGGQMRFGNTPDRFQKLFEGAAHSVAQGPGDYTIGVAPHSLRAVDGKGLALAVAMAGKGPIHMHLAEQVAEVEEVQTHLRARPAEWLLNTHDVNKNWCLIHCTQMTDQETIDLAKSGAVAGLCPITESSLGDGIFNGKVFLDHGGAIGVGSDSNIHIALFDELRTLEYSQRLRDRSRAVLATTEKSTGRVLFDATVAGGAQAAGRNAGQITPGKLADLVALQTDNPYICNRYGDPALDSAIFGGHGQACVTDVWAAGRHVVKDGRHSRRDAICARFQKTVQDLGQEI